MDKHNTQSAVCFEKQMYEHIKNDGQKESVNRGKIITWVEEILLCFLNTVLEHSLRTIIVSSLKLFTDLKLTTGERNTLLF